MGHEFHELTRIKFSTASDGFTAARGCADWGFTDEREAALPIVREILRALLSEFNRRTRPEFCTLEAPLECGSLLPPWFGAERGEESFRVKAQSSSEPLHACFVNQTCARHVRMFRESDMCPARLGRRTARSSSSSSTPEGWEEIALVDHHLSCPADPSG